VRYDRPRLVWTRLTRVVVSGEFSFFLLRKHFITEKLFKKKSGEVKDSVIFPLFFLLHKRAKPAPPPLPLPPPTHPPIPPPIPCATP
jgi:hypothetical protein